MTMPVDVRRSIAVLILGLLALACGQSEQTREGTTVGDASASPCPAPALRPAYLPSGVRPVDEQPLFGLPERTRTWKANGALVQLNEGFSADHGDNNSITNARVRGDESANVGSIVLGDGSDAMIVDWLEDTRCGSKQYAVVTRGFGDQETLKIARSLRGDEER